MINLLVSVSLLFSGTVVLSDDPPAPYEFTRTVRAGSHEFVADFTRIEVPESHGDPASRKIAIAVCRLRSSSSAPGVPMFYLPGLPTSATGLRDEEEWANLWAGWLPHGDVVLVDHRGSGESRPRLVYNKDDWKPWVLYTDETSAYSHIVEIGAKARELAIEQGVDLGAYNTLAAARDLDMVREALGYTRINLVGHSSGSHLALTYLREFEAGVHRLISIGTAGPNDIMKLPSESDAALRKVAALIREDPAVAGDLVATFRRVLDMLDQKPLVVAVKDPRSGRSVNIPFGRFGLQLLLIQDLADVSDLPHWPRLLKSIEDGDRTAVQRLIQKRVNGMVNLPLVLFTTRAASGASPQRWERIRKESPGSLFGRSRTLFCPEIGQALGVPDLGDGFRAPLQSSVPALFVSGSLDAHTPPEQAERVRSGLPNSVHVILQNAGHDRIIFDAVIHQRMVSFLIGMELGDERIPGPEIRFLSIRGPSG